MFRLFERSLKPTAVAGTTALPAGLVAFYWHFARQAKGLFAALFAAGFAVALLDITIPVFIGKVVTLVTNTRPDELFATAWPMLVGMENPVQVATMASTASDLVTLAVLAAGGIAQ